MKISDVTGTACDGCKHFDVCKFSEEFISAQQVIDHASISVTIEDDGKMQHSIRPISNIDYILPIKLQCKYMERKPVTNVRDYNAASSAGGI